jgi:N-methylhydantoinase B
MSEYERRWHSLNYGYVPGDKLEISDKIQLHTESAEDVDPITYEVLRSRLWAINQDHQDTIRRISGSGVTVYAWDFNVSVQTEDGEGVVFGPGILFFAGMADSIVKWTLEHRAGNVGIHPGDVFIQCDPWVGTNHAMDTAVYAPIFIDGKLFCWVYNCVHQQEVGGVEPGGFVQQALDNYWEATGFPPMKLVAGGEWREDVADAWIRRSRMPALNLLEIKSQVAGVEFARSRIQELIEEYGALVVKGVMRGMISNTEKTFQSRLSDLPNGTWRDVRYVAGSLPGDREVYKLALRVTHEDGRLRFDNHGTSPSHGSFNTTAGVWRAAVVNAALPLLAWDQYLCGAGVLRCLDFDPSLGSITSAEHPAAISTSLGVSNAVTQAQYLFSKMIGSSRTQRGSMLGSSALHTQVYTQVFGIDQHGRRYTNFPFDGLGGGSGALAMRDGLDHGGGLISSNLSLGNVEEWERVIPFLYLYRNEVKKAGHGRYRGGAGIASAWAGHKTNESFISSGGVFQSVTQGIGLSGGYPGSGGMFWAAEQTDIESALSQGQWPSNSAELRAFEPRGGLPMAKKFDNPLRTGDLFEVIPGQAAGHGDPLLRETDSVEADIAGGWLDAEQAERIYGVLVDSDGRVNEPATKERRERERADRLDRLTSTQTHQIRKVDGEVIGFAIETVAIIGVPQGQAVLACIYCTQFLGDLSDGYRGGCGWHDITLQGIDGSIFLDPREQVDADLVLRHYVCPGCGTFLDSDVCLPTDSPYQDVAIHTAPSMPLNGAQE